MQNTGTTIWGEGYQPVSVGSQTLGAPHHGRASCAPGESVDISFSFVTPLEAGDYRSTWRLADPSLHLFGDQVWT